MNKGCGSFKMYARKSLDYHDGTVSRNMDIKLDSGKGSGSRKESWRESLHFFREYINNSE